MCIRDRAAAVAKTAPALGKREHADVGGDPRRRATAAGADRDRRNFARDAEAPAEHAARDGERDAALELRAASRAVVKHQNEAESGDKMQLAKARALGRIARVTAQHAHGKPLDPRRIRTAGRHAQRDTVEREIFASPYGL